MSVHIVEESCLNKIINFLRYEDVYSNRNNGQCEKLLNKMGYDLENDDDCEALFQDMHNLNIQAVESRYPDDDKVTYSEGRFKYTVNPSIHQALKSIRLWLYQCREMERSKLYVTLRKTMDTIITSAIAKILPAEFWKTYIKEIYCFNLPNTTRGAQHQGGAHTV